MITKGSKKDSLMHVMHASMLYTWNMVPKCLLFHRHNVSMLCEITNATVGKSLDSIILIVGEISNLKDVNSCLYIFFVPSTDFHFVVK